MIGNDYSFPLGAFILGMSYLFWRYVQHKWSTGTPRLPMPYSKQTSWIWGHELQNFQHEAYEMYIEWAASVGLVYRTKAALFQSDIIIVGDNVAAHHILQNAYSYVKPTGYWRVITRLVGKGIAGAEGEDHRYQRKLLAPAFTSATVEAMTDDIISCVDQMTQNLRSAVEKTNNGVLDFVPIMSACTLDIIGRVCFGHDFKGGESTEAKAIISAWHHDVAVSRTFAGFLAPILINIFPWITRLPIPAFRDGVVRRTIHQLAGKLITDSSENADAFHGKDILSILINRNNSEARLTTTELLDNIATFLVAGHETSSVTIAFILLHVARNPSIQSKLQQEIRTGTSVDYNRILELEYLNAVVKEGLRLHPVGATPDRIALYDDVIPLNQALRTESGEMVSSFSVKAGQVFRIPSGLLNTNKQIWGNDADQFIPERWIEPGRVPPIDKLPYGPWAGVGVSSFSDGPRSCMGYRLGVLEINIAIAALVRSFEFGLTEAKITQYLAMSLQPFADGKVASMPLKISLAPEL